MRGISHHVLPVWRENNIKNGKESDNARVNEGLRGGENVEIIKKRAENV